MPAFQLLACGAPLLMGIGLAGALALTAGKAAPRRAGVAGAVAGGILLLLLVLSFGGFLGFFPPVALLLVSFGAMAAGLYLFLESCRLPREASQLAVSLLTVLLMGTIFCFGPSVIAAADGGAGWEVTHARISLLLQVNPWAVISDAVFGAQLLNTDAFYNHIKLAEYQHSPPRLGPAVTGYLGAGLALFGASRGVAALRRPKA